MTWLLNSFLNPALLAGTAAISVPIIIHILNRRRFKVLRWAAMDFLLDANRKNRKRVNLEHLLVLLLRCLAIALVVAMVARPVLSGSWRPLGGRDLVERIVIVDDSASTGAKDGDRTAFDDEKKLLHDLLDDLARERPGDLVTVVRGSRVRQPDLIRSEAKSQRTEELARRIENWQPSDGRFPVVDALAAALGAPSSVPSDASQGARDAAAREEMKWLATKRYVYVLSDLRRSDWMGEETQKIVERMRQLGADPKAAKLGGETNFILIDAGQDNPSNVGIVEVRAQERLVTTGIPQKIYAAVKNYGKVSAREVRLELSVGQTSVPIAPIPEIKPGETQEVELGYTFADAGPFAATVRLEKDRFPADDRRDLALEVVKALRVLLVDGKPTDEAYESATYYAERALAPPGEVRSGIEAVTVPLDRLKEEDLSSYHAVVLCDVDRLPQDRISALERYVRQGGGLAFFLGDDCDPASYERELWRGGVAAGQGEGLLPCKLGDLTGPHAPSRKFAPLSLDHAILRVFQGQNNPFLSRVKSTKYFSLPIDGEKDKTTQVIARYEDVTGTPAIIEKAFGDGRVVLFNITANKAWSGWPAGETQTAYLIVLHQLVHYLAPASTKGTNLTVGHEIARAINPAVFEPKGRLHVPGEKAPRELLASQRGEQSSKDALWLTFPETTTAGVYQLELVPRKAGAPPRIESYAVELDRHEGELEKADKGVLRQAFTGVKVEIREPGTTSLLAITEGERHEIWRTLAFLLLGVLALEGVLSFIAAHHGSAAPADEIEATLRGPDARPVGLPTATAPREKSIQLPTAKS